MDTSLPESTRYDRFRALGLNPEAPLTSAIFVNARLCNLDDLDLEITQSGMEAEVSVSRNDVEKIFTALCPALLREQTEEETRVGNIARSWSILKTALRLWLQRAFPADSDDTRYRVFINDVWHEGHSVFRRALTETLRNYRPIVESYRQKRREAATKRESQAYAILPEYSYTEDYEACTYFRRSLLHPFYIRKDYNGKKNEMAFIRFLDAWDAVDWWLKNGDCGKEHLGIAYENERGEQSLFYPDWIVRFRDNTYGIFDTKSGFTATSEETQRKAAALDRRIKLLNGYGREMIRYVGGIVIPKDSVWKLVLRSGKEVDIKEAVAKAQSV